ncbi:MAG: hypothetical protein RLZZ297_1501 [Chloroflexota bacterium]
MHSSKKNNPNPAPGTITAIRAQVRDSQRVSLEIDGEFALGISLDTLAHEGIFVGQVLDAVALSRLVARDAADNCRHAAIRLLEIRPRSTRELTTRLRQKGYDAVAIDTTLQRLRAAGLLDDTAFATYLIEQRMRTASRGSTAIQRDLALHGIDRATRDRLAVEHAITETDADHALSAARAYAGRLRAFDRETYTRRLSGVLLRRGFPASAVRAAVQTCWREKNDSDDER